MTDLHEPLSTSCSNPGRDDYWTCPACYADQGDVGDDNIVDCACGHRFKATLEHEPVCRSTLIQEGDEDDD